MSNTIPPITTIPVVTDQVKQTTTVQKTSDNKTTIKDIYYTITTYDHKGRQVVSTNVTKLDRTV